MGRRRIRMPKLRSGHGPKIQREPPPDGAVAFKDVNECLQRARQLFRARRDAAETEFLARRAEPRSKEEDILKARRARQEEAAWTRSFHQSFTISEKNVALCGRLKKYRLNRLERELLLVLVLDRLALIETSFANVGDLLQFVCVDAEKVVKALRYLSEEGKLHRAGLIDYDDEQLDLRERELIVDPVLVETVLFEGSGDSPAWKVKSEDDLFKRLTSVTDSLKRKTEELERHHRGYGPRNEFYKMCRKTSRLLSLLKELLDTHSSWGLSKLLGQLKNDRYATDTIMLLALVGKSLGHLDGGDSLFTGMGLARAACGHRGDISRQLWRLRPSGKLLANDLIQPAGGSAELLSDDPGTIAETEFELSKKSLGLLEIERRSTRRSGHGEGAREPVMDMGRLVLSDRVERALGLALNHARHSGVLVGEWGLGEILPYGRAVTLQFSGPPGVGKTACAEALASELGKSILVADYARIQNCFVGQTEKNIVRTFKAARAQDALLFWDEADAMFFNRDAASKTWDVRNVNVLLQELEHFEGVCVLATNRKGVLDPALARRISLKVDFERPDHNMRVKLWQKLLPNKMPLADDVDFDRLATYAMTGGEIKNAVLNAARIALGRGPESEVTMDDLLEAAELEINSSGPDAFTPLGFKVNE